MTIDDFKQYKSAEPTLKPNWFLIPKTLLGFNDRDIKTFNDIYAFCVKNIPNQFTVTVSGGISIAKGKIRGAMWTLYKSNSRYEIVIRNLDARYYRFVIGYGKDNVTSKMSGRKAFKIYTEELLKDGFDIRELAIADGYDIKKTIPQPKIKTFCKEGKDAIYTNAHHLDINSAYNAGMMEAFPQLEKTVRRLYEKRKENPDYKNVLNMTQGYMQSEHVYYAYSHVSKAGHTYTHNYIDDLTKKLEESGRTVLAWNTDGIWYQGEIYHDEREGKDIGQWKNDHINCTIRFKSRGAYEFIENDKYYPVVRGCTTYERFIPREEWQWGDIFKGHLLNYIFVEGEGIKNDGEESL